MTITKQDGDVTTFAPDNDEDWIRLAVAVQQGKVEYPFYKEHNVVPTLEICLRQIDAPTDVIKRFLAPVFVKG